MRRWLIGRRLTRLVPGNTLGTFCELLGEPRSSRRGNQGFVIHTWETPDLLAAAVTEWNDVTVLAYRVERTNRRFRPTVSLVPQPNVPALVLRLGRTTLAEAWAEPMVARGALGASTWEYRELNYLGRPGQYRHYALLVNDLGASAALFDHLRGRQWESDRLDGGSAGWGAARATATVDGYVVYDHELDLSSWPEEPVV